MKATALMWLLQLKSEVRKQWQDITFGPWTLCYLLLHLVFSTTFTWGSVCPPPVKRCAARACMRTLNSSRDEEIALIYSVACFLPRPMQTTTHAWSHTKPALLHHLINYFPPRERERIQTHAVSINWLICLLLSNRSKQATLIGKFWLIAFTTING